jgi:hypothetical protein
MHLEPEAHTLGVEDVDDRAPALGEVLVAVLDLGEVVRRKGIEHVPDRRAGEPVHLPDSEQRGGPRGVLHPFGRTLPDAVRIAVPPDLRRQDRAMPCVDRIADGLADEVRAQGEAVQVVALEHLLDGAGVTRLGERLVNLEMVAPAGELEPVEAPPARLLGQLLERQIGPLTGEERDGPRHRKRYYDPP